MKKITINEIAKLANTSKTTVSFYLNNKFDNMSEDTKKRIAKVIKQTNYTPSIAARLLNNSKTKLIGIIISDITNVFSNQIVKGIEDCTNKRGYQIILASSNYDFKREEKYIDKLIQLGVDGFIVQPTISFQPLIEKIKANNKALIFIDSNLENDEVMSVKSDNYNSVYNSMKAVIKKNHYNNYIIIGANPKDLTSRQERANGFIDCIKDNNLEYTNIIVSNRPTQEEIREKLIPNIRLEKNNFIFVPNCWLLPKVNLLLDEFRSFIPKTIGILGFDNTEWCHFVSPKITTIVQPAYDQGYLVADKLISYLENEGTVEKPKETLLCNINWSESIIQ